MDATDRRVLEILRDALDADPASRGAFVAERCGRDTDLHARVSALLHRIGDADAEDGLDTLESTPRDALIGTRLGAYRIVERTGRGGMGVVYRAEREGADFRQEVAIKLIRRGFDFDDIAARFLRERRILAQLAHPAIARFIDGGVAPDHRPWFALEFVHGVAITRWCDRARAGVRDRVRLLVEVAAAVQYAHARLVVHRDLKPGNILVDADGAPHLLDFGVAGLLAGESGEDAPTTIALPRAMTPEYAPPEYFRGEDSGIAGDVYALGAILFELVSGALPYAVEGRDAATIARSLDDAPSPSLASALLRDGADVARTRLDARSTTLSAYRRTVRGDLARIVDKAIARDPARRYATVDALARDLSAWLAGDPVRVAGSGRLYRIGRFVARHRVPVALAAVALVAIAALAGFHVASLRRQLAATEAERSRAQSTLDFLKRVLESPNPDSEFGPETKLGDFLASADATLRADRTVDREVRDEIALTMAASLRAIGRYDDALRLVRPIASGTPDSAAGWRNRIAAASEIGQIETLRGHYESAIATLKAADVDARAHGVDDPVVLATLLSTEAVADNHLARWNESIALGDRALAIAEPIRDREPALYANLLGFASIPRAYPRTDLAGAEMLLRRSLSFQESHGLADSGFYLDTKGELAQSLVDDGRFDEAERMLLDVIAAMRKRYGENHRETAFKISNLALLYLRWNRMDDARRWRDEATRSMEIALGPDHPFMALDWIQSADTAFYSGDAKRAAADAAKGAAIAAAEDRKEFAARAALYAANLRCVDGDAKAADELGRRVTALGDAFGVRAFDVRLAAADCYNRLGRHRDALAAIAPFAAKLAAGAPIPRTDYFVPDIERVRREAGEAPGQPSKPFEKMTGPSATTLGK